MACGGCTQRREQLREAREAMQQRKFAVARQKVVAVARSTRVAATQQLTAWRKPRTY